MKKNKPNKSKTIVAIIPVEKAVKLLYLGILLLFFCSSTYSQNIRDLKTTIDALKTSSNATERATGVHLYKLAFELNSALYIKQGEIVTKSVEPAICAYIDIPSIKTLYTNNPKFESIEYLEFSLSDFSNVQSLDIAKLSSFKSLKYIHFICNKECTIDFINNLINNKDTIIQIYYSIETPK
jgi:hypothetical protein